MASVATTISDASITLTPELIGEATSLKQLQALLKSVNPRGFEHVTKKQALTALIHHAIEQAKSAGSTATPSPARPLSTALPTSPASSPSSTGSFPDDNTQRPTPQPSVVYQGRWEEHDRKLEELDHRLEELDRRSRQLNLIIYNLSEERKDPLTDVWELIDEKHRHEMCVDEVPQRLGRRSSDDTRSRPVRVKFGTLRGKHLFLKHAKVLRQAGFRLDDDLTRLQQKERKSVDAEFKALKSKGYSPFFRGSQLQYFHAEKMHTCRKGRANSIPHACALKTVTEVNTMQKMTEEMFSRILANFEAKVRAGLY
ncbi:hypothetical protein ABBQ38_000886 [Trebouxia sp. C0009 RCD-2024]